MRIAVFSDVHANLSALQSVFKSIQSVGVDQSIFLGDIVGYGADVSASIDLLTAWTNLICLKGNHDRFVLGELSMDHENNLVKESIAWARTQINEDSRKWMAGWPLKFEQEKCCFVHASGFAPETYPYVWKPEDLLFHFPDGMNRLWHYGHTHRLKLFEISYSNLVTETREPGTYRVPNDMRAVINVGSVGQPRDGVWTAAYVLIEFLDPGDPITISLCRVPYAIDTTIRHMEAAGFSSELISLIQNPSRWKNN